MKKVSLVLLSVFLISMFAVSSVFAAGVIGTPHDITTVSSLAASVGACSTCHIPHKSAGGGRLWASSMTTSAFGVVGNLCSSCHNGTAAGYGNTLRNASGAAITVYHATAHGLVTNIGGVAGYVTDNAGADTEIVKSGLPYSDPAAGATGIGKREVYSGARNRIECTTCHNVHDNAANRPFLRVSIKDLCIQCHFWRFNDGSGGANNGWVEPTGGNPNAVLGNWFGGLTADGYGLENPGSHPVGMNVDGDKYLVDINGGTVADSPIVPWTGYTPFDLSTGNFANSLMQPFDDATTPGTDGTYTKGAWNLGMHVANDGTGAPDTGVPGNGTTGGVVCVSCHAIHGVQDDSAYNVTQVAPSANLLARAQTTMDESSASTANGNGDDRNNLCEICHFASTTAGAFATNAFLLNGAGTYGNANRPNPGATPYTHPIDDALAYNEAVSAFPSSGTTWAWPQGSAGGNPIVPGTPDVGNPKPICESCHVPHPARAIYKGRGDVTAGTKATEQDYILRDDYDSICNRCHGNTDVSDHHPISTTAKLRVAMGTAATFNVPGAAPTRADGDGYIGDGDNVLECNDCHNGSGAHNWSVANGVGLDADWEPRDNGRTTDAVGVAVADQSKTCEECHYLLRNSAAKTVGTPTHSSGNDWVTEAEFQKTSASGEGLGTHYLGVVNTALTNSAGIRGWTAGLVWNGSAEVTGFNPVTTLWPNGKGTGAWSRWDGTSNTGDHLVCESCHELEPDKNARGSKLLVYWFKEATDSTTVAGLSHAGDNNGIASYFCEGCHGANGPSNTHAMTGTTAGGDGAVVSRTQNPLTTTSNYLANGGAGGNAPKATPAGGAVGFSTFPAVADRMDCDSCHQTHDAATASTTYILDAPNANVTNIGTGPVEKTGNGSGVHPLVDTTIEYTKFCDQCHWYTKALRND